MNPSEEAPTKTETMMITVINMMKEKNPHNDGNDAYNETKESNSAIPVIDGNRTHKARSQIPVKNVRIIQSSNKVGQALDIPSVMNINPPSVYNKNDELQALISEEKKH